MEYNILNIFAKQKSALMKSKTEKNNIITIYNVIQR